MSCSCRPRNGDLFNSFFELLIVWNCGGRRHERSGRVASYGRKRHGVQQEAF